MPAGLPSRLRRPALVLGVTAWVTIGHGWLLQRLPLAGLIVPPPTPNVMQVEWIAPPAPPAPPPAPEPPAAPPRPVPRVQPLPRPAPKPQPAPLPVPLPATLPALAPEAVAPESSLPYTPETPETTATPEVPAPESAVAQTPTEALPAADSRSDTPSLAERDAPLAAQATAPDAEAATAQTPPALTWYPHGADTPGSPPAFVPPPAALLSFRVEGLVKGFTYHASASLLWQPDAGGYRARQEISAFLLGERSQTSTGHITARGLQPARFEDRQRKKLRATQFDWDGAVARFEPEAPPAALGAGTQDRLSVFLQLAGMVAAAPTDYPAGTGISVPTASTRALELWHFVVQQPETLPLPVGDTATLRLQSEPRAGRSQTAQLWLAPALGYLPVRIRLSEPNGDFADLQLRAHRTPPQ